MGSALRYGVGCVRRRQDGRSAPRSARTTTQLAAASSEGGPAFKFTKSILFTDMNSFLTGSGATSVTSVSGVWRKGQKRPVTYNYTFGIQRELGWHTVLDVAYVGNNTHHNSQSWNFNALPAGVRFLPSSLDTTTPSSPLPDSFLRPFVRVRRHQHQRTGDHVPLRLAASAGQPALRGRSRAGGNLHLCRRHLQRLEPEQPVAVQRGPQPRASSAAAGVQPQLCGRHSARQQAGQGAEDPSGCWTTGSCPASLLSPTASCRTSAALDDPDNFDFTGGGESCGVVQTGDAKLPRGDRTGPALVQHLGLPAAQRARGHRQQLQQRQVPAARASTTTTGRCSRTSRFGKARCSSSAGSFTTRSTTRSSAA